MYLQFTLSLLVTVKVAKQIQISQMYIEQFMNLLDISINNEWLGSRIKKNYNIAPCPQLKPPGRSSGGGV